MKVCHILTANPETSIGGTPIMVRNIRDKKSIVVYGRGIGLIKNFLYPLLIPFMKREKYDLIHIHDMQGYGYALFPMYLRKRIVYTAHGLWINYFKVVKPDGVFQEIKAYVAKVMQGFIARRADIVVAVSNKVKCDLIKYYNISPERIRVIHNGVDTKKFFPKKGKNKDIAIWVGDNSVLKGLKKAITYVNKKGMKLIIVGIDGKNKKNLEYIKGLDSSQMMSLYNKAGTLLFFSRAEGHPLVPLEAMACGLNVIASKESNIEIVPPRRDGTYKINGNVARRVVLKHDWSYVRKKYQSVYRSLIV